MSFLDLTPSSLVTTPDSSIVGRQDWEGPLPDGETNEAYHKRSEFSSSDIKHMLNSPFHFKRLVLEKGEFERESNEAFDLGSSAHECFLEQTTEHFVAIPDFRPIGRLTIKAQVEEFKERHAGKRFITLDQHKRLMRMFDVISSKPLISALASDQNCMIEKGFTYRDPQTGLKCKFRPDILNIKGYPELKLDGPTIIDYKTAISANRHEFSKAAARYHYALSAVHYMVGFKRLYNEDIKHYLFIVQEKSEPFGVALYRLTSVDQERAMEQRTHLMKKIKHHLDTNNWPDWSEEIVPLSIPGYAFSKED